HRVAGRDGLCRALADRLRRVGSGALAAGAARSGQTVQSHARLADRERVREARRSASARSGIGCRRKVLDAVRRTRAARRRGLPSLRAAGYATAVWNFTVDDAPSGSVRLATETRIRCVDAVARRRFRPYWAVVRLGSSLIRISMLRAIAQEASR